MARKKRSPRPPPPVASSESSGAPPPPTVPSDEIHEEQQSENLEPLDSSASIDKECERALTTIRHGNRTRALNLIKATCARHQNSALAHRVQGTLYAVAAYDNNNGAAKQRLLNNAVESAKRACALSPNSIEFSHFYAYSLFSAAIDSEGFELALDESSRGLSIPNPIDPAKDNLYTTQETMISAAEARIESIKRRLLLIMQNSKHATMFLKGNHGQGTDYILENIRRIRRSVPVVDQMFIRSTKRPNNEIQEAIEIPQEPRTRASTLRLKKGSKVQSAHVNRIDQVRTYWNSMMSVEEKRQLFEIRISDLRAHFSSRKDKDCEEILAEALKFAENSKTWKFLNCCVCNEKFVYLESFIHHLEEEHLDYIPSELRSVLPMGLDAEWVRKVLSCPLKPVDTSAALRSIENQKKCQLERIDLEDRTDKEEFSNGQVGGGKGVESQVESGFGEFASKLQTMVCPNDQKWPLSDDCEREKILERIHGMLELLLRHKFLATCHVERLNLYAKEELQKFVTEWQLLVPFFDETLLGLRFLKASQLEGGLKFLEDLSQACGLSKYLGKCSSTDDNGNPGCEIRESIVFTGDFSCLLVDERLLHGEISIADGGSATVCAGSEHEISVLSDSDNFINWLFVSSSMREQVASWTCLKEDKMLRGLEIFRDLKSKSILSLNLIKRKYECLSHWEALQAIHSIFTDEFSKRVQDAEYIQQFCGTLLNNWLKELSERKENAMSSSIKVASKIIKSILEQAKYLHLEKWGVEALTHAVSHLCGPECIERTCILKDYMQQSENFMRIACQRQIEDPDINTMKLCEIDARILRSVADITNLENDLGRASGHDFRSVMFPLLRSFMRAQLENLVDKDATEKSGAATEALLAELALDAKKKINKGGNQTKHSQVKSKDKKRLKDYRKQKEPKVNDGNKQVLQEEDSDQVHFPVAYGGQNPNSEVGVYARAEELELEEDELRSKTEFGTEERNLEDTKEYERLIENEVGVSEKLCWEEIPGIVDVIDGVSEKLCCEAVPGLPSVGTFEDDDSLSNQQVGLQGTLKEDLQVLSTDPTVETVHLLDIGTGLKNDVGEYNCFLNVIIQSLWHVRRFRNELLSRSKSGHAHIGDPCVVCALYEIFNALHMASTNRQREAVDPTSLRIGLSNLSPDSNFFQEGQMNDACEVLAFIFNCLHRSFATGTGASGTELEENKCLSSWDCSSDDCIAHALFGMDIIQRVNCVNCGLESRHLMCTSFFHDINVCTLREMKIMHPKSPFVELLKFPEMNAQLSCDLEAGGCGELNNIHHILSTPPPVFVAVLGWQTHSESAKDISATLTILTTEIDVGLLFQGLDPGKLYRLISVVCYSGQHFRCFAYNHELQKWILFDDKTVEVIGCWNDVLAICEKRHLQPQVLFFEAV